MHFIIVKILFLYQYMQSNSGSTNGVSLGQGGLETVNNIYFTIIFGDANSEEMSTLHPKLSLSLFY